MMNLYMQGTVTTPRNEPNGHGRPHCILSHRQINRRSRPSETTGPMPWLDTAIARRCIIGRRHDSRQRRVRDAQSQSIHDRKARASLCKAKRVVRSISRGSQSKDPIRPSARTVDSAVEGVGGGYGRDMECVTNSREKVGRSCVHVSSPAKVSYLLDKFEVILLAI